jgi:putative ABC transport system permease protein
VFVRQRIKSIAILKCVGATNRKVLATYVVQVGALGLAGSLMGVGIAALALRAIPDSLFASFGAGSLGLTTSAVAQGVTVGLLVSLLFALVPLLQVRRVKPLLLLRSGLIHVPATGGWAGFVRRIDWLQVGAAVLVTAALVAVASWQAASLRAGAIVSGGFVAVALALYGAAWALVRATAPLASARWFPLRHAMLSLRRPGNQTRVVLLSVGLGCFFVMGVRALQQNLVSEAIVDLGQSGADLFLIDIQRDQVEDVRTLVTERLDSEATPAQFVPTLRARVTAVHGRHLNLDSYADVRGRGSLAREYVVTYRSALQPNEELIAGEFWQDGPPLPSDAEQEVSIEERIHTTFQIQVGDRMRFDVLGRTLDARVTSVRRVNFEDARRGGFIFVFRPGALAQAPHTFIGFVRGPADATARARLQHELVLRFPNVTAIDARDILARFKALMDNILLAVSVVGGVALVSGVLILVGAVAMTKFERVYEAAILRTLGASTRMLSTMLALEYWALGLIAGLIGAAGALALSWAVATYLFDITWRPSPILLTIGALLTSVLVVSVGILASLDVLRRKPLGTLRAE